MQPDAGIPTFYMLTFALPYELLDGVLTNYHQPSAFDTPGSKYETTRRHIPQEGSRLSVRLYDSLTSSHSVADVLKLIRSHTIFYAVF